MSSAATSRRRHLSDDGIWRPCTASVKPCGFEQHRVEQPGSARHDEVAKAPVKLLGPMQNDYYYLDEAVRLAPDGASGKYCPNCSTYVSSEALAKHIERDHYTCSGCEKQYFISEMPCDLRADQLRLLDEAAVKSEHWFHISQNPNWDAGTKEDDVVTHLGSKEAALERMGHLISQRKDPEKPFYLHEVSFNSDVEVKAGLWHDLVAWPEQVGSVWDEDDGEVGVREGQVQRYMNFYEGPGTVSLLADPNSYTLVTSVQIPERA